MALRRSTIVLIIFFLLGFLTCPLFAAVPPVPNQPPNYIVDLAGIIDPQTEANLNRRLKELENRTTAQVVVLTIKSLEGEPIEKFSLKTAQKWALGQKGKDNGVLITVAVQDRKYRIEVGYGLEAILPDSYLGSLARQHFVPNFRQGKYSQGIDAVVSTIAENISSGKAFGSTKIVSPEDKEDTGTRLPPYTIPLILTLLAGVLVYVINKFIRAQKKLKTLKLQRYYTRDEPEESKDEDGDYHGGWFSGFGGGGFGGGFGGGGGGGFGGGGVSGSW